MILLHPNFRGRGQAGWDKIPTSAEKKIDGSPKGSPLTHLNRTTIGSNDPDDSDPPEVTGDGEGRRQVQFVELKDALLQSSFKHSYSKISKPLEFYNSDSQYNCVNENYKLSKMY